MTPHGDTALQGKLPFWARVVFIAAVNLAFLVLGTTAARALDLGQAVEDTAKVVDTVAEPIEKVTEVVAPANESEPVPDVASQPTATVAEPVDEVVDQVADSAVETVEQAANETAETVVEPVAAIVEEATDAVVSTVEETTETVTAPVEHVVNETAETVVEPVAAAIEVTGTVTGTVSSTVEVVGEAVGQVEGTVSEVVEATTEVIVGQIDGTANSVVDTTMGVANEKVEAVMDEVPTPTTGTVGVTVDEAPTRGAAPPADPEVPANPIEPPLAAATHRLVPDASGASFVLADPGPPPSNAVSAPATPQMPKELARPWPHAGFALPEVPALVLTPPSGITTAVAMPGSTSPGTALTIVFLAAALLLIGHVAPRWTEWLRLRPLIWRDNGLALAIERPG